MEIEGSVVFFQETSWLRHKAVFPSDPLVMPSSLIIFTIAHQDLGAGVQDIPYALARSAKAAPPFLTGSGPQSRRYPLARRVTVVAKVYTKAPVATIYVADTTVWMHHL